MSDRKLIIIFLFIIFTLLLRDAPYLNVFIISKLWIVFILLISAIVFSFIPRKTVYLWGILFLLPFIALIFVLTKITIAAEVIGVIFYSILWFVALYKIFSFMGEKEDGNK